MSKRQRLEQAMVGELPDRPPVMLWRHFPGDDQRAADLARSIVDFQQTYDWDVSVIAPASTYSIVDHGLQDEWRGASDGTRAILKRPVLKSIDWTTLRPLDPERGSLGRQIETTRLVLEALGENVPVVIRIDSPLLQADLLAGTGLVIEHIRTQPDRLHTGLGVLTETILRFTDVLKRYNIAGVLYTIRYASYAMLSEDEYSVFGLPYDQKILDLLPARWWLKIVRLQGDMPMFKFVHQYRAGVVNWHDQRTEPSLTQGRTLIDGAVCGGLSLVDHLHFGTPALIRSAAREVFEQTNSRRLILGTGGALPLTTPLANIRAVRDAVQVLI